ncbi:Protein trichome birefringence-like 34 [Asimina triloba]
MGKRHAFLQGALRLNSLAAALLTTLVLAVVSLTRKSGVWVDTSMMQMKSGVLLDQCNLFSGRWVFDNVSYPLYSERQCTYMSDQLACEKFGRQDFKYQNWRWQPHQCNLPRFNATALLERLRGKRLVFVGDSLNRGQWVSMVCLLDAVIPSSLKSMYTNGSLSSFRVLEYNASVEFYWAPLLVESNSDDPVNHRVPDRTVRANSITKHARHWTGADILVFNSYLWWRRWGSFEDEDGIYKELDMLRGFEMALETWSNWLEFQEEPTKTQFFFVSLSPTHQRGYQWGATREQNCYNETEMITEGYTSRELETKMMQVVESTIERTRKRGVDVTLLNITQLSEHRKDGHPSIYRKHWDPLTEEQISNPRSYADCIHWCLPGVPDVWNELLAAYILREGERSHYSRLARASTVQLREFVARACEDDAASDATGCVLIS